MSNLENMYDLEHIKQGKPHLTHFKCGFAKTSLVMLLSGSYARKYAFISLYGSVADNRHAQ